MPDNSLHAFHPVVSSWFQRVFGEPTDVQRQAWASIMEGRHTLIAAPTGSGKTLAALLPCIDAVVRSKLEARSPGKGVRLLYITPLKALNNDIQHHVLAFAQQLDEEAGHCGMPWPGLASGVRTGDTPSSKRAAMAKKPPELLITTPESLYILLTSEQGRGMLRTVTHIIVDEIHDLAGDKRGAHLSLSLERLESLAGRSVQRIGVSATQNPLWRVAQFLGGWSPGQAAAETDEADQVTHPLGYVPRQVHIVESWMQKRMKVSVTMPDTTAPAQTRDAVWLPILKRLFDLMEGFASVLLFTNSRRLCERLVLRINDHAGIEMARAHHGSMSKEKRLEVEAMLKNGELRCLVATSSLELGIDVGHIDLVIQIDSPLDAASGIQRIGRAGHAVGDVSRGVIVVRQRGVLPEAAVLGGMIAAREIEPISIPSAPLDVLSQQAIAIVASADIAVQELYRILMQSDSYRELSIDQLESVLAVLAGLYPFARPIIDWDRQSGLLRKRGNTAIAAMTGAGTIPQSSQYPVHHSDSRVHLGELDEEFVHESRVGDVFLLGTTSWMIRRIDKDRVYVSEASNSFSEIPFWRNEGPGRTLSLGMRVGELIEELSARLGLDPDPVRVRNRQRSSWSVATESAEDAAKREEAIRWLEREFGMEPCAGNELIGYIVSQHAFSELPTAKRIVIEHYRDMMNQTHIILLNPYGRRVNRTWLLAIQRQFEQALPYSLYGNAKDNGIEFVLPEWDASWLRIIGEVTPANVEPLLTEAVTGSPLLAIAFRRIAETALLLSRSFTRVPMWQKRLRSEELLRESLPYADSFPFLAEAMKECIHNYLDLKSLKRILSSIRSGEIEVVVRETEFPSPMASQFLADYVNMRMYEGDGLDPATKAGLLHMSKDLAAELFGGAERGGVSEHAIRQMEERLERRERALQSAEDMLAYLKSKGDSSLDELVKLGGAATVSRLGELAAAGKAKEIDLRGPDSADPVNRWISADEAAIYESFPVKRDSAMFIISRYADGRMSFTEPELCERYPSLAPSDARALIDELLGHGVIQQAPFASDEHERLWSSSKVASQIVRLSIGEARKNAKAMEPERWCGYLAQRQHALEGARLRGREGLLAVIGRMQGLFLPATHWESFLFPSRVADYRKEELDGLCASGEVIWLGNRASGQKEGRIAFFLASNAELLAPYVDQASPESTAHPELLELLKNGGASFLTQLSRQYGKTPSETLAELLDLVWEGHASNDQFAPLRISMAKKSRDGGKAGSGFGRWYWTGSLRAAISQTEPDVPAVGPGRNKPPASSYWIRQLLDCYGIVTKELVAVYTPFRWDEVLPVLNRLEEWGAVTRGIFVEGAAAIQFTTPEIASELQALDTSRADGALTVLSAMDPASPYGLFIDWPSKPAGHAAYGRKPGSYLALSGSAWRYWVEGNGKKVFTIAGNENDGSIKLETLKTELRAMFGTILRQQGLTKIVIEEWNGEPVASSEGGEILLGMGAERDRSSYVLWMSRLS